MAAHAEVGNDHKEFYTLFQGKLTKISKIPKDKYKETTRTKKDGSIETIYICNASFIDGRVTGLSFRDVKEFQYCDITIDDGNVMETISLGVTSREFSRLINYLIVADLSQAIEVHAFFDQKAKKSTIFVKQNGSNIKQYSSKDDPKEVPQPIQKTRAGKPVWDWDDSIDFFYQKALKIGEILGGATNTESGLVKTKTLLYADLLRGAESNGLQNAIQMAERAGFTVLDGTVNEVRMFLDNKTNDDLPF